MGVVNIHKTHKPKQNPDCRTDFTEHSPLCFCFSSSQVGSPSSLSDPELNQKLRQAAHKYGRTLYVPSGALWGGQDIQRLNDSGGLKVALRRCVYGVTKRDQSRFSHGLDFMKCIAFFLTNQVGLVPTKCLKISST